MVKPWPPLFFLARTEKAYDGLSTASARTSLASVPCAVCRMRPSPSGSQWPNSASQSAKSGAGAASAPSGPTRASVNSARVS